MQPSGKIFELTERRMITATYRSNDNGFNVVLYALQSQRLGESNQAHLCRTIVGLTKVTYIDVRNKL